MKRWCLKKFLSMVVVASMVFANTVNVVAYEYPDFTLSIDKQISTSSLGISIQKNDSTLFGRELGSIDLKDKNIIIVEKGASFMINPNIDEKINGRNLAIKLAIYRQTQMGSYTFEFENLIMDDTGFFEWGRWYGDKIFPADNESNKDESNSIALLSIQGKHPYLFIFAPQNLSILKSDTITAKSTNSTILVNGKTLEFDTYNIDNYNYFRLRDLAMALNGTEKQFNVKYRDSQSIELFKNTAYIPIGGELAKGGKDRGNQAKRSRHEVIDGLTGETFYFKAYNINGNNYFKLRDIAKHFNFGVTYDNATKTVGIDTAISYTE